MLLETMVQQFRQARSVNQTSSSFVDKLPTTTEPSGDAGTATGASVIDLSGKNGIAGQNGALIVPYGVGSDTNTFSFRIIGWRAVQAFNPSLALWIPVFLAELQATISSSVPGIAGSQLGSTTYFANTLTITTGNANVSIEAVSPASTKTIAHCLVDLKGFQKLELSFTTASSATSCNALLALL